MSIEAEDPSDFCNIVTRVHALRGPHGEAELEGRSELEVRDRDKIGVGVEGRVEDELKPGCNRRVWRESNIPIGIHAVLIALAAARKDVIERPGPHDRCSHFAIYTEGAQ